MPELAHALSVSALLAGTLEYTILVRRREALRAEQRERENAADVGLRGLVRVLLVDELGSSVETYRPE